MRRGARSVERRAKLQLSSWWSHPPVAVSAGDWIPHLERWGLSETIRREAKERGVSPHTLVNLWLQEKIQKLKLVKKDRMAELVRDYKKSHSN